MMVCGTDPRHKTLYVSHGGDVHISFTEKAVLDTLGRFVLHYQGKNKDVLMGMKESKIQVHCSLISFVFFFAASKCNVPKPLENSHVMVDGNIITVKCNNSDTKWEMKCDEVEEWLTKDHRCYTGR